jgi:hypothetical protein
MKIYVNKLLNIYHLQDILTIDNSIVNKKIDKDIFTRYNEITRYYKVFFLYHKNNIFQISRINYFIYKAIPRSIKLDILTFLALENFEYKLHLFNKQNSNVKVNEILLKILMKDYGMINMPDAIIDLSKRGYDELKRRLYLQSDVIRNIIIIQAATAENERNNDYIKTYDLGGHIG